MVIKICTTYKNKLKLIRFKKKIVGGNTATPPPPPPPSPLPTKLLEIASLPTYKLKNIRENILPYPLDWLSPSGESGLA